MQRLGMCLDDLTSYNLPPDFVLLAEKHRTAKRQQAVLLAERQQAVELKLREEIKLLQADRATAFQRVHM